MERLEQMAVFVAIADHGSMAAVARARALSPSTVTLALQQLESHLGVQLFVRSTRQLSLTPEGERYHEDCQRILADIEASEQAVMGQHHGLEGRIRVTATNDFGRAVIAPWIGDVLSAYPGLQIDLLLSDRVLDLIDNQIDVALRFGPLADSQLMVRTLHADRRRVCASPGYWAAHPPPSAPAELAAHNCLLLSRLGAPQAHWAFQGDRGQPVQIEVSGDRSSNDGGVLRQWALADGGVIWKPGWDVGADIAAGRLVEALEEFALPSTPLHALHTGGRRPPRRVRVFLDALEAYLHKRAALSGNQSQSVDASLPGV